MIWVFTGKTGSGKTFQMVRVAYRYWRKGVDVYSNTVLEFEKKKLPLFDKLKKWLFKKEPKRGRICYFESIDEIIDIKGGIILFDEAQVLFNARNWESLPDEFQYKLQQHRKHKLDLLATCQNLGTIDIMYRRLVQHWYHCRNIIQLGKSPKILFGLYRLETKDVDEIYNQVDDLTATTLKNKFFFIGRWSKKLYDTMYDIGFRRTKVICLSLVNELMKRERRFLIIPKRMPLREGLRQISSLKQALRPEMSSPFMRSWRR